jgi:hypothetical protein
MSSFIFSDSKQKDKICWTAHSKHSPKLFCSPFVMQADLRVSVVPNALLKFATFPKNLLSFSCNSILPYIFLHNHLSQSLYCIIIHVNYTLVLYTIVRASKLAACRVQGAETTMFTKMFTYLLHVT